MLTFLAKVTASTPHERIDIHSVSDLEVQNVVSDALDGPSHVQSEDAGKVEDRQPSFSIDQVVRVGNQAACFDLDKDIGRGRNRFLEGAELKGFPDFDQTSDVDFRHDSRWIDGWGLMEGVSGCWGGRRLEKTLEESRNNTDLPFVIYTFSHTLCLTKTSIFVLVFSLHHLGSFRPSQIVTDRHSVFGHDVGPVPSA